MDAKLMVATDPGDFKKLKNVLNKEDAVAMVVVTATSKKPSDKDQPPTGNINPILLSSARRGFCGALNVLLEMEDAGNSPTTISTQEFSELATRGGSAQGKVPVPAAGDVENQPAASLAAGALLKGITPDGDTALHVVAGNGDGQNFVDYAGIIYERDSGLLFAKNHKGGTPLHCAARAGNSKMVSHLIDLAGREGADTKLRLLRMENKHQETALHEAVRFEDGTILGPKESALLVTADPTREEQHKTDGTEGAQNEDGKIQKDDADGPQEENNIVKLLMHADSQLANYPGDGISPLYLAILLKKSTIALTLYDMSGGNLSYSGAEGQNALHISVLRDKVMVDFLIHWNKSLTAQVYNDGSTPLHFASSICREQVFRANPAALYQADKNGYFPIHVAATSVGAIDFFHGECPDSVGLRDAKGKTFLHVAVEKRRMTMVSYVCRASSLAWILNMQDNEGNTALHLAIQAGSLRLFCALLGNLDVNLNLTNSHGNTPLDLSRNKIPRGLSYTENSESKIMWALGSAGADYGAFRQDKRQEIYNRLKPKDEEKESEMLKTAAQALIVASVLIATVTFTASFALPGGYIADDHMYGGSPIHAGSFVFDAFMMATTLAFICSSVATVGFVFAATPMVNLVARKVNFQASATFMWHSVTSLSIAFALGVYMVLAPVTHSTAVAICVIAPAVLLGANMHAIINFSILARPLCTRVGLVPGIKRLYRMYAHAPIIVTFGWAALARIHHRHR